MPPFAELVAESLDVSALVVLLIFTPFLALFTARVARGRGISLRPIVLYDRIRELVSQAAETGMGIHLALGRGSVGTSATPDSVAGLYVLDYVARHAAQYGQSVASMAGDGSTYALARGIPANGPDGSDARASRRGASFAGEDPLAFAAGAGRQAGEEPLLAKVAVGAYGAEGLWIGEEPHQPQTLGLGGTADLATAALLKASMDEVVLGEDVYAAGAYLGRRLHLGSLVAQDLVRVVIILSIIVGVALTSLGYWG